MQINDLIRDVKQCRYSHFKKTFKKYEIVSTKKVPYSKIE